MQKQRSPFRLKLNGSNFQEGVQVFIMADTSPWSPAERKSDTLIILLKGGGSLKARFPQGQKTYIHVKNPDGGTAETSYTRP